MDSTLNFGSIYGPAGGQAVSTVASTPPAGLGSGTFAGLPGGLMTLVVLGVMAWWALEAWD